MALGRVHVCNDLPRDISEHDPPRTYVLGENRSSIQSLALMRLAIISHDHSYLLSTYWCQFICEIPGVLAHSVML